jgi:hypothetical protein
LGSNLLLSKSKLVLKHQLQVRWIKLHWTARNKSLRRLWSRAGNSLSIGEKYFGRKKKTSSANGKPLRHPPPGGKTRMVTEMAAQVGVNDAVRVNSRRLRIVLSCFAKVPARH